MSYIFLTILNISITASYIALAAIVMRLLLKRNPKWITCILWALLAVRLLVPFSFESKLSLVPSAEPVKSQTVLSSADTLKENNYEAIKPQTPVIEQEVPDTPESPVIEQENPEKDNTPLSPALPITPDKSEDTPAENITSVTPQTPITEENKEQENKLAEIFPTLSYIWTGGVLLMLAYSVISFARLKRRVRASIPTDKNIYICDDISTPFILGVIKPRIYLPSTLSGEELEYITSHEKSHLKRLDHLWKPLGFVLLAVHWFNPLMWVSYILLCKDIELACDEKVLKSMGENSKKHYSETLLTFSTERKLVSACPLAFGEVGVKQRIKNILNYKKPAFWVTILCLILCLAIGFCFLTNPVSDKEETENTTETTEVDDIFEITDEDEDYTATLPINKLSEGYLKYIYKDEDNALRNASIKLYPKNTSFEFSVSPLSSTIYLGTYEIVKDKLILRCDGENTDEYVFRFTTSYRLEFIKSESAELPKYKYSDNTEATEAFEDKAIFRIELTRTLEDREEVIPYTYEEIIEAIIAAYPWMDNSKTSPLPNYPHVSYKYISHDDLSEIGYTLIDLDSNGVEELLITGIDQKYVYDAYTMIDGKTVHLFTSGDRYFHRLYEGGYIYLTWSGGSTVSGRDFMRLSDGRIEFIERTTLDSYYAADLGLIKEDHTDMTLDDVSFKSNSENEEDYVHITYDELTEILNSYKQKPELEYSLTPLSEYNSGDIEINSEGYNSVYFDIDRDGEEELCSLSIPAYSSTQTPPLMLTVSDNGAVKNYEIADIRIDTSRNTAYDFYLKKSGNSLYVFLEENIGVKTVYELFYNSDNTVTASETLLKDVTDFDIDSDGKEETLRMYDFDIYSQDYPFVISATEGGVYEYYTEFVLPQHYKLSFQQKGDKLYVICTSLGTYPINYNYQVLFENGNIVLDRNGERIPTCEDGETIGNMTDEELSKIQFSYIIDKMHFDIDKDGKTEKVTIAPGFTSGIFSFSIMATENGEIEYHSHFAGDHYNLSFEIRKDGTVYLKATKNSYMPNGIEIIDAEVHEFDINIVNSEITLTKNGVHFGSLRSDIYSPSKPHFGKISELMEKYAEGYKNHDVEMLNSCFDHIFIDPEDAGATDAFVNTVLDCEIISIKFKDVSDTEITAYITYELTYSDDYLGVGNRMPGYNLVSADFNFVKSDTSYLIHSMDLESATQIIKKQDADFKSLHPVFYRY